MNNGEYGVVFALNADYDISGFTSLSLTFTKPSTETLTVTDTSSPNAVSAPATDLVTDDDTFTANEYFQYTFKSGDVDEAGTWSVRGTYVDGTKTLITESVNFVVGE